MKPVVLLSLLAFLMASPACAHTPPEDIPMYAVSLIGSPYRLGGISPETGLDCSGFVGHVFRQTTGIVLPRDSHAISEAAQPLAKAGLLPGDLVFFNTLNRAFSHVGIYLGDDRFVHAASNRSGAVMISNLNDRYWRERFDGARRVTPPDNLQSPERMSELDIAE
ncbi:MAG TPA: NlpC/P60 family protein [Thiobacillus sp.]|nr:NlpC/P60 family protein [Thiobacillus sp.]